MLVLVTGATGKVGQTLLDRMLSDSKWAKARIRALCHNRSLPPHDRVETVKGSISDRDTVNAAMAGVTHVIHMATVKEDPQQAMDVSVKGMFWLLEAFRTSATAEQFMLIGGDCVVGHIISEYDAPITEESPRKPYPGVYALSKVIEEVMLEQYYIQYGINGCCLRAPWIMEKDDFKHVLSFGDDQFGGPPWEGLISAEQQAQYHADNKVPLLIDAKGETLKRNFVHVTDLVEAMLAALGNPKARQHLFNVAMNRPVDYGEVAQQLEQSYGFASARIETPFHSNWLDNTKARLLLDWEPKYDLQRLVSEAFPISAPQTIRAKSGTRADKPDAGDAHATQWQGFAAPQHSLHSQERRACSCAPAIFGQILWFCAVLALAVRIAYATEHQARVTCRKMSN